MATLTYVDIEGALRTWLRSVTEINALAANRVFFSIPDEVEYPLIVVQQVGGGPEQGEAPITTAVVQFDVWGSSKNKKPDKIAASRLKTVLEGVLQSLQCGQALDEQTIAMGAQVQSVIWLPDPGSNQARYAITAAVSAKAA